MKSNIKVARRTFLRNTLVASAESDPTAKALGYLHDATAVDTGKYPNRATPEGQKQFCHNCKLYQAGADGWGGCSIFQNKLVKGEGWCSAWTPA